MQKLLLILLLFCTQVSIAQRGYLFIKKKGYKKVKAYPEGSAIVFETTEGKMVAGYIGLINKNDSMLVNSNWYQTSKISKIVIRGKVNGLEPLLWTTGGVALSTAGMTLAGWADFEKSLGYSAAIGYGNFLIRNLPSIIVRKKYKIGRKFTLQTLDLHFRSVSPI